MNEETGVALLRALEGTVTAFAAVESVSGASDAFGNSALLEVRNDLAHLTRRIRNLALLHGADPGAVEKAKEHQ